MVVGAVQGASCFGPAYEYALTAATDLRRRKIRDKAPITFVTSEPYIGHLGLGGVGDTKGLLEIDAARPRHQVDHQRQDRPRRRPTACEATEVNEDGSVKKTHKLPFEIHDDAFPLSAASTACRGEDGKWIEGLTNPRGFVLIDKHQRNPELPQHFRGRRLHRHPAVSSRRRCRSACRRPAT